MHSHCAKRLVQLGILQPIVRRILPIGDSLDWNPSLQAFGHQADGPQPRAPLPRSRPVERPCTGAIPLAPNPGRRATESKISGDPCPPLLDSAALEVTVGLAKRQSAISLRTCSKLTAECCVLTAALEEATVGLASSSRALRVLSGQAPRGKPTNEGFAGPDPGDRRDPCSPFAGFRVRVVVPQHAWPTETLGRLPGPGNRQ